MLFPKYLFFCCLGILISFSIRSQTIRIKFDFATKTITNFDQLSAIKSGDYLSVEIDNFNPFLYQAQIAFSDSTISTNAIPNLFSTFFDATNLTTLVANLGSSALKIFPGASPPSTFGLLPQTRSDSVKLIARLIQVQKQNIIEEQIEINKLIQRIQLFVFDKDTAVLAVKKWNLKTVDVTNFSKTDQQSFYSAVKGFFDDKNTIRSNILSDIGHYENYAVDYGKYIKENPFLHSADSLTRLSNNNLLQTIGSFDTTFTFAKFEAILSQLINLNQENFKYISLPTQIRSDITKVDLAVIPWSNSSNLSSYKASWQFPILPKSYFNFSTDFYAAGLYNQKYFASQIVNSPGDTSYAIGTENTSKVEVGITVLLHYGFYFKKYKNLSYQFTFGPGLSIQKNPMPRLLLGVGLGVGRKNKIMISTGLILGEVEEERSYYKLHETVKFAPSDLTTPTLKPNVFVTIGYSIL